MRIETTTPGESDEMECHKIKLKRTEALKEKTRLPDGWPNSANGR
jgi:hypothetical protein